jgi:translation initiation factor 2D
VACSDLRDIELKECVAIAVQGNPIPFAVGLSTVSWEGVQHNGLRGKGVRILHVFGDYLCHKWNKNRPLNEGFSLTRIRPTEPIPSEAKEEDVVEEGGECGGAENVSTQANEPELGEAEAILDEACEEAVIDTLMDSLGVLDLNEEYPDFEEEQDGLDLEEDEESVNAGAARADASEGPGPEQQLSGTEEEKRTLVDNLLERCLLRAFHYIIKDKFLPVLVSSLWAILLK